MMCEGKVCDVCGMLADIVDCGRVDVRVCDVCGAGLMLWRFWLGCGFGWWFVSGLLPVYGLGGFGLAEFWLVGDSFDWLGTVLMG